MNENKPSASKRALNFLGNNAVPIMFIIIIAICIPIAGFSPTFLLNEIVTRLSRNAFLILSLLIPIMAGMGLNFGMTLGAMAAEIALILTSDWQIWGIPGIVLAMIMSIPISALLGLICGRILNAAKGREMITSYIISFFMNGVYQLVDDFSLFYLQFVKRCQSRDGDYWTDAVSSETKNNWRGLAFERLCLAHVRQIKFALGISGVHTDVYSWRTEPTDESRGAQVDLLIDRKDGIVNLCEMKYSREKYAISKDEHDRLQNRVAAFGRIAGRGKSVHLTMVTTCGLVHNKYWNDVQSEVVLDDLFRA